MKLAILFAAFAVTACASEGEFRQKRLMDEIEQNLVLPAGALPLNGYARYYTDFDGQVVGAYTTSVETRAADGGCSEITKYDDLAEIACPAPADLKPGNRRWVKMRDYPGAGDGGCRSVNIVYDPKTKKFVYVQCDKRRD